MTRPDPGSYTAPTALRRALNGDLRDVYGRGPVAVILPLWHPNVNRNPHGWYGAKVGWWIERPGALQIAARRLDRGWAAFGHGETPDPNIAAHRLEATGILLPTLGCWQIAGGVGHDVLTWVLRTRS